MAVKLRLFSGKKILKFMGYFFFFLVVTIAFTYLTLPFEKIKARYIAMAEARLNADIIGKIEKSWFTGIEVKNLRITPRAAPGEKAPPEFEIEEGTVRLSILPLFLGRVQVSFAIKLTSGENSGRFTHKKDGDEIEANLSGIELKSLPFLAKALAGKQIEGVVAGSASLLLAKDISQSSGKLDLTIENAKLASFQMPIAQWGNQPFTIPELKLGTMKAEIDITDGAATFKEVKFTGSPDIEAQLEGYALLRQPLGQTELRAYLKFKFSDGFFQRNPKFSIMQGEATLKSAQRPDRFFGFMVEGPIGVPALLRRTPSPNPPGNLTPPKGGAAAPNVPSAVPVMGGGGGGGPPRLGGPPVPLQPGMAPPGASPPGMAPIGMPPSGIPPPRNSREAFDAVNKRLGK